MMRHMHTNIDTSATGHTTGHGVGDRYNIPDAAKVLGLTEEAVRQRVKRGTLNSIKVDGKLYVLLEPAATTDTSTDQEQPVNDRSRLVDTLESEITHLRRQLEQANERDRENRRIIAALTQRIPELEPAIDVTPESRESPTTSSEEQGNGESPETEKRSWWRRFFGFD